MSKNTIWLLFVFFVFANFTEPALAIEWQESPAAKEIFAKAGLDGTFVLYDTEKQTFIGYNQPRASKRFVPASTYKIAHSLIALATGAVSSVDEILPYGGKPQPVKSWENDMSMREAIKVSSVPIYQEIARRIGQERMLAYLEKINFGNAQVGNAIDSFWLDGSLAISAFEQSIFLEKLAKGVLPIAPEIQEAVREITFIEQGAGWQLFAKTGTATRTYPLPLGWWVGWVEKSGKIYTFALNIDMKEPSDNAKRISIGKECLAALGVL